MRINKVRLLKESVVPRFISIFLYRLDLPPKFPFLNFIQSFYLLRKSNLANLSFKTNTQSQLRILAIYKRKAKKVRLVNAIYKDSFNLKEIARQKEEVQQKIWPISKDLFYQKYNKQFIAKLLNIASGSRFMLERVKRVVYSSIIIEQEREVLLELLYKREAVLVSDFVKIRRVRDKVTDLQIIKTVDYKLQIVPGFLVPKAVNETVIRILKEKIRLELLENYNKAYKNPWFFIKKKSGAYRIVDTIIFINKVTIKDTNLLLNIDEFSEDFAGI